MLKIVLLLPPYTGQALGPPLSLLSLAGPLRQAGYEVKIIDAALEPDYLGAVAQEIPRALCFGVSLLTGPMIVGAMAAARLVKRLRPELPVVFGGWHPSLLPEQTLREEFVDVIVRHQGEITFLEVVRRMEKRQSFEMLPGCWFKQDGRIHQNPDRSAAPIGSLPPPAFELVDFDAYEKLTGERVLPYATSVGCPYACHYCTDSVFYNRRFNAYTAERTVEELVGLVRRHRLQKVALLDSNFLVDTRRAVEMARGFLASDARFEWSFQASTDLLCRMSDEEVRLLGASGVSHIGFGTESASEQVLALMNKRHQRVGDMFETARKCRQAGIRITFNIILGYPGETDQDRQETWRVMSEIGERFDNVTFSPNIFTPYPGIPIWPQLRELGVREPQSLEAWSKISLGINWLPWLSGENHLRLERSVSVFLWSSRIGQAARRSAGLRLRSSLLRAMRRPLQWRLQHQFFQWPLDLWLLGARERLVMRRSLLTGRTLGSSLQDTCAI